MRILGLDPGLRRTGWGIIDAQSNRMRHIANGTVLSTATASMAERLAQLFDGVTAVLKAHKPDTAAVEEVFVNKNPVSTLKLGQARGVVMLAPAAMGITVTEYGANHVKKSVVGSGHAGKQQIGLMIQTLLPGADISSEDAADALAVAICHAHRAGTQAQWDGRSDLNARVSP